MLHTRLMTTLMPHILQEYEYSTVVLRVGGGSTQYSSSATSTVMNVTRHACYLVLVLYFTTPSIFNPIFGRMNTNVTRPDGQNPDRAK